MTVIYCYKHRRSDIDSCERCEKENPIWQRSLTVHLNVNDIYLDSDGIGNDRSHEWEGLLQDIKIAIERYCNPHYPAKHIEVMDAEWLEGPVID